MPHLRTLGCIGCLMAGAASPVAAQSPPDAGIPPRLLQDREDAQRQRLEAQPSVRMWPIEAPLDQRIADTEMPCFAITSVRWDFAQAEPPGWQSWLDASLAGAGGDDAPQGRCVGSAGLGVLQVRAQDALLRRGYITSRVVFPEQNLQAGELRLIVIPGTLQAIRVAKPAGGGLRLRGALPMRPGDILFLPDLEQALENFRRVPTAEAEIRIEPARTLPGQAAPAPGQSDLVIDHNQGPPLRLSLAADDSGTRGTGKYLGSLTLSYDSPLRINDLFYLTWNRGLADGGPGGRGSGGHTVHYDVPWGYWLLAVTASANRYQQQVAGLSGPIAYRGSTDAGEAALSRVVQRDSRSRTTLTLKAWRRSSRNFIDDTEVLVQRRVEAGWELRAQRAQSMGDANLEVRLADRRGTGALGSLPAPEDAFGGGTSRPRVISGDLDLALPLQWGAQRLRYSTLWRVQFNRTPLVPMDRFAIGGHYTVRGFDGEYQLSAEHGWLWRNELALPLPAGQEVYAGVDHGHVGGPSAGQLVGAGLRGAVLGLRGSVTRLQYDIFLGAPISKPPAFKASPWTVGFSLNWTLGPFL